MSKIKFIIYIMFLFIIPINLAQAETKYDNNSAIYGYVEEGNSFIPIGQIARELGLVIIVNTHNQEVSIQNGENEILLKYNETSYIKNGLVEQLSQPSRLMNQTLYTPTRDILDALGIHFELTKANHLLVESNNTKLLIHMKPITSAYNYSPNEVKVVMYHHFEEDNNTSLIISPEKFREHLNALMNAGYETITDEDLLNYQQHDWFKLPKKPLLITIDDGYYSNYEIAYPILKEKGLRATIYIVTSYRGNNGYYRHFTWQEAKEMYDSGVINIESHTHNLHYYEKNGYHETPIIYRKHNESATAYRQRILDDFNQSRQLIKEHIGKESISLSYPYGAFDNKTVQLAKEAGFTFQITLRQNSNLSKSLNLISRVNASGKDTGQQLLIKLK